MSFRNWRGGLDSIGKAIQERPHKLMVRALALSVLLVAYALQTSTLTQQSLWFDEFVFSQCSRTRLEAVAGGAVIDLDASQIDREVKAVTLHELAVSETERGLTGRFILDI